LIRVVAVPANLTHDLTFYPGFTRRYLTWCSAQKVIKTLIFDNALLKKNPRFPARAFKLSKARIKEL
jgi:hypothetical protein